VLRSARASLPLIHLSQRRRPASPLPSPSKLPPQALPVLFTVSYRSPPAPLQLRWLQLALAATRSDKDTAIVRHLLASLSEEEGAEDETVF